MKILKQFERMMKRLQPYLPRSRAIPPEKRMEWVMGDPRVAEYPPVRGRHVEDRL